jgi:hypothetical protein
MSKPLTIVALVAAAAASSGCSSLRQAVGAEKVAPDEFRVVTRAPLQRPPDYALRPPRPGEARPQELGPSEEARMALFGQDLGQDASAGERRLVASAGAETAPSDIRETVDFEGANIVYRDRAFADRVEEFQGADATEATTQEQEAVRRVTGGAPVTIERGSGRVKLPGS